MLLFAVVAVGVIALSHVAPFPFLLDALTGRRAVWRMPADPAHPTVYLTFDDGPNPTATPQILDVLARERAHATFFLIDRHVTDDTAPIVRRIADEGHAIALHSHTRALMTLRPEELVQTLGSISDRLERLTGRRPCRAFRPHAGWRGGLMLAGLKRADLRLVGWGWNLWDWNWFRPRTADSLARRIARRASAGSIVVIHDGHHVDPRADRRYAIEATARLIPALRARGFAFGTICDPSTGLVPEKNEKNERAAGGGESARTRIEAERARS